MAYHWAVRVYDSTKTRIRSESIEKYRDVGDWKIYDSEAEAIAALGEPQFFVNPRNGAIEGPVCAHSALARSYQIQQGWLGPFSSGEAARAALPTPIWAVHWGTGTVRQCYPAQKENFRRDSAHWRFFDTEREARESIPAPSWGVHRALGTVQKIAAVLVSAMRNDGWKIYATQEEAARNIVPKWLWSGGRYKRAGSGDYVSRTPSAYSVLRRALRVHYLGDTTFTLLGFDYDVSAVIDTLYNSMRRYTRGGSDVLQRLNAMHSGVPFELCDLCESRALIPHSTNRMRDGAYACRECLNDDCSRCRTCNELGLNESMEVSTENGRRYHPECLPEHVEPDGSTLDNYSADVMRRRKRQGLFKLATGEPRADLWLGYELEVHALVPHAIRIVRKATADWAILKSDGSLSGGGFEIVTVPGSLAWHRQTSPPFLLACKGTIGGWEYPDCGMHVHVGRAEVSAMTQGKLLSFMHDAENAAFIDTIAGRPTGQYCVRGKHKKRLPAYALEAGEGRYQALNFHTRGEQTIEFRIFRSNTAPLGLMKNLEFVHALVTWCRVAAPLDVSRSQIGITVHGARAGYLNFIQWAALQRYPALNAWFQRNGYTRARKPPPFQLGDYVPPVFDDSNLPSTGVR